MKRKYSFFFVRIPNNALLLKFLSFFSSHSSPLAPLPLIIMLMTGGAGAAADSVVATPFNQWVWRIDGGEFLCIHPNDVLLLFLFGFWFLHLPLPRIHTYIVRPTANMIPSPYTACTYEITRRQIERVTERGRECFEMRDAGTVETADAKVNFVHIHTLRSRKERGDGECVYKWTLKSHASDAWVRKER